MEKGNEEEKVFLECLSQEVRHKGFIQNLFAKLVATPNLTEREGSRWDIWTVWPYLTSQQCEILKLKAEEVEIDTGSR